MPHLDANSGLSAALPPAGHQVSGGPRAEKKRTRIYSADLGILVRFLNFGLDMDSGLTLFKNCFLSNIISQ